MPGIAAAGLTALLLATGGKGTVPAGMIRVPAGSFAPIYGSPAPVRAFALDRLPVTRGEFLTFVQQNRAWSRSNVGRAVADMSYLAEWSGDLAAGSGDDLRKPVVNVSWYAANAYCAARGKRLPTTAEWERAASAGNRRGAGADAAFEQEVLGLYALRNASGVQAVGRGRPNALGIFDLHDLVWEWTQDVGAAAAAASTPHGHEHSKHDSAGHATCASAAIGAANTSDYAAFLRNAVRTGLERTSTTQTLGFRCAASVA